LLAFPAVRGSQGYPILHRLGLRRVFKPVRCVFIPEAELRARKACSTQNSLQLEALLRMCEHEEQNKLCTQVYDYFFGHNSPGELKKAA
jgi:hypothetical protein